MPKLFVIMPFGVRPLEHGTQHDFDRLYREAVRPAAEAAGWDALRIDELVAPGSIQTQYLTELLQADLVLADISVPNGNVYYELGIGHAISPTGAILLATRGTLVPFDISQQRIVFYDPDPTSYEDALIP